MEDFVTFEIAKKLKEKGYPQEKKNILAIYDEDGEWYSLAATIDEEYCFEDFNEHNCVCPTIFQVLKWLREKEIYVLMECPIRLDDGKVGWPCIICNRPISEDDQEVCVFRSGVYDSYEDAALKGIKVVLNNFI